MTKQRNTPPAYMVSVDDDPEVKGAIRFTFVPKNGRKDRSERVPPQSPAQYIVCVRGHGDETTFNWINAPTEVARREELEDIARRRATARHAWLKKLSDLVATVKQWADEADWATRSVDKKMEDGEIGSYKAPGLLMQQATVRLFLEPVARSAPGADGVVDLYLMPSYDDIASLYYYNNRWNVHYMYDDSATVGNIRETKPRPLTETTLREVFEEMKAHAG